MTVFTKTAVDVFAAQDASGAARKVSNHDVQVWGTEVERALAAFQAGGGVVFDSKTEADGSLDYNAYTMAWIFDDDPSLAGIYQKQGASGSGSWQRVGDLPYSFIRATNTNSGNPDAITADTAVPIPAADGGALISLNIVAENTADAPTVSFNGGAPLTITDAVGTPISAGGLSAGMLINGYKVGATFRVDLGPRGWSPLIRVVQDGARRVEELYDWTGGHGAKPSERGYLGPNGLTDNIAEATDIRGPQGPNGPGTGDMLKADYDPRLIEGDVFDAGNQTGRPKWWPKDVPTLLADAALGYNAPLPANRVQEGDILVTQKEGFRYRVASSGAIDADVQTVGGVNLYVLPDHLGRMNFRAWGEPLDGTYDNTSTFEAAWQKYGSLWIDREAEVLLSDIVAPTGGFKSLRSDGGRIKVADGSDLDGLLHPSGCDVVWIEGLTINGNRANQSAAQSGSWGGLIDVSDTTFCKIEGCYIYDSRTDGIDIRASSSGIIQGCRVENCGLTGTKATGDVGKVQILYNRYKGNQTNINCLVRVAEVIISNNQVDGDGGASISGIVVETNFDGNGPSQRIVISNNIVTDCGNASAGVGINLTGNSVTKTRVLADISGNVVKGCRDGIAMSSSNGITITGGSIEGSLIRGINVVGCSDVTIQGVKLRDHDNHTTSSHAISITSSANSGACDNIKIIGGSIDNSTQNNNPTGIFIQSVDQTNIVVGMISISGCTTKISRRPTRAFGCIGYVSENYGVGQIIDGNTSATLSHGLDFVPDASMIQITWTNIGPNDKANWYVTNITATTFDVIVQNAPSGGNFNFSWRAGF